MLYKTIHTTIGLQLLASAEATGSKIEITHMAVGD
ncbi:phage tail protein, partial [Treponema zioleckii]